MDQRYYRLRYLIQLSNKTCRGMRYHESPHENARRERPDRHKNKDRRSIRFMAIA